MIFRQTEQQNNLHKYANWFHWSLQMLDELCTEFLLCYSNSYQKECQDSILSIFFYKRTNGIILLVPRLIFRTFDEESHVGNVCIRFFLWIKWFSLFLWDFNWICNWSSLVNLSFLIWSIRDSGLERILIWGSGKGLFLIGGGSGIYRTLYFILKTTIQRQINLPNQINLPDQFVKCIK